MKTVLFSIAAFIANLALVSSSFAATNTYAINDYGTPTPNWSQVGKSVALEQHNLGVRGVALKSIPAGHAGGWKFSLDSTELSIVGGTITMTMTSPDPKLVGRLSSVNGSSRITHWEGSSAGATQVQIKPGGRDLYVELLNKKTSAYEIPVDQLPRLTIHHHDIRISDATNPVFTIYQRPSNSAWVKPQSCLSVRGLASDKGSGLSSITLRRIENASTITAWTGKRDASSRRGETSKTFEHCISANLFKHGVNTIEMTISDMVGNKHKEQFKVNVDLHPPTITSSLTNSSLIAMPAKEISINVTDAASGIASVSAELNGAKSAARKIGDSYLIDISHLKPGAHKLTILTTDRVGNSSTFTRSFTLKDVTPPTIVLSKTAVMGGANLHVAASATDLHSGINASSWRLLLNGKQQAVEINNSSMSATLVKLTHGKHTLQIRVSDDSGNQAQHTFSYTSDTHGPEIASNLSTNPEVAWPADHVAVKIADTESTVKKFAITLNGQPARFTAHGSEVRIYIDKLEVGEHKLTVTAKDQYQNSSQQTFVFRLVAKPITTSELAIQTTSEVANTESPSSASNPQPVTAAQHQAASGSLVPQILRQPRVVLTAGAYTSITVRTEPSKSIVLLQGARQLASTTSNEAGIATIYFRTTTPRGYRLRVGSKTHQLKLAFKLRPKLTVSTSSRIAKQGNSLRVAGRIHQTSTRKTVIIEARIGTAWYPVKRSVRVKANGQFSASVNANQKGRYAIRARILAGKGWRAAKSNVQTLRVK